MMLGYGKISDFLAARHSPLLGEPITLRDLEPMLRKEFNAKVFGRVEGRARCHADRVLKSIGIGKGLYHAHRTTNFSGAPNSSVACTTEILGSEDEPSRCAG